MSAPSARTDARPGDPTTVEGRGLSPAGRRWPWVLTGLLLVAAAGVAFWSNWINWLPCQGEMLKGSTFSNIPDTDFSVACLDRMDNGAAFAFPGTPSAPQRSAALLGIVAQLLTIASFLVLLINLGWSRWTRRLAAILPIASGIVVLVDLAVIFADLSDITGWPALFAVEVGAIIALAAVVSTEPLALHRKILLVVVLWGVSGFGLFHMLTEYSIMASLSTAIWDSPPGTGYLTVAVLAIAGIASLGAAIGRRHRPLGKASH